MRRQCVGVASFGKHRKLKWLSWSHTTCPIQTEVQVRTVRGTPDNFEPGPQVRRGHMSRIEKSEQLKSSAYVIFIY